MSISRTETDIILNKANVALARSQRLVASWLPPQSSDELANSKSEEELQREEDEIFTAVPETLGIGAPLPSKAADGSWNRTELDSNDKLRRQLLGKNYKKVMSGNAGAAGRQPGNPSTAGPSHPVGQQEGKEDDDDYEDEGRTATIGKKRNVPSKKRKVEPVLEDPEVGDQGLNADDAKKGADDEDHIMAKQGDSSSRPAPRSKGRKKATSFLDEILADRSKKRKK